jgi:hypothetical protein
MKRTTTGSKLFRGVVIAFAVSLLSLSAFGAKKKEKPAAEAFAVISGTTFRPPGLSLPGVKIRVRPEPADTAVKSKLKGAEAVSDTRGEFAVRVPAVPAKWSVDVSASGYQPQSKSVSVEGEQRLDLSFVLEPETKK